MVNEHLDSGRPINSINLETLADSGGGSEVILCCFGLVSYVLCVSSVNNNFGGQ